jgi:hypothetical protein
LTAVKPNFANCWGWSLPFEMKILPRIAMDANEIEFKILKKVEISHGNEDLVVYACDQSCQK